MKTLHPRPNGGSTTKSTWTGPRDFTPVTRLGYTEIPPGTTTWDADSKPPAQSKTDGDTHENSSPPPPTGACNKVDVDGSEGLHPRSPSWAHRDAARHNDCLVLRREGPARTSTPVQTLTLP